MKFTELYDWAKSRIGKKNLSDKDKEKIKEADKLAKKAAKEKDVDFYAYKTGILKKMFGKTDAKNV